VWHPRIGRQIGACACATRGCPRLTSSCLQLPDYCLSFCWVVAFSFTILLNFPAWKKMLKFLQIEMSRSRCCPSRNRGSSVKDPQIAPTRAPHQRRQRILFKIEYWRSKFLASIISPKGKVADWSRLLQQVIPKDDEDESNSGNQSFATSPKKPGFSLPTMSTNFRRFNAR